MKQIAITVIVWAMILNLTACVSQADYDALVEKTDALTAENQSLQENLESLKEKVTQQDEQLEALVPYEGIISNLQNENYAAVTAQVDELQKEKMKQKAGDIKDYLVTVELTSENFEEYFELVNTTTYNAFGEEDSEWMAVGAKSLKYQDGWIILHIALPNGRFCGAKRSRCEASGRP